VAAASWLRYLYLAHVTRPTNVRQLYRLVKRHQISRLVEVGIADIRRSLLLIEVAQRFAREGKVSYTGIDWFDERASALEPLSLKDAYRDLRATGANVRLVPGEPGAALAASANVHSNTDLILVAHLVVDRDLERLWFYVPRMLHGRSLVLREQQDPAGQPTFSPIALSQIAEWGGRPLGRRAA
jgi:hypothetical protein